MEFPMKNQFDKPRVQMCEITMKSMNTKHCFAVLQVVAYILNLRQ